MKTKRNALREAARWMRDVLRTSILLILCVLAGLLATGVAFGQADQGAITGLVQDASGAVVPNAQVTLTNVDNGLELQAQTDSSGNYVFSPVKIGNYNITVTAFGFSKTTQEQFPPPLQECD